MSDEEKKKEEQPKSEPEAAKKQEEKAGAPIEEKEEVKVEEISADAKEIEEKKIAEEEAAAKKQAEEAAMEAEKVKVEDLRPGMTIRLHQKIKEGEKERIQVFQGIIIALKGNTPATKTVTLQKTSFGVMVEKIFPLASPLIEKIEVVKIAKVRRSKLYYLRDYTKRLKETLVKK